MRSSRARPRRETGGAATNRVTPHEGAIPAYSRDMLDEPNAVQIRVALVGIEPPIWRRLVVPIGFHLGQLHRVIQAAFGWWDYHLHEFEIGRTRYGMPDPSGDWNPSRDERRTRIDAVAKEGTPFQYTYDFGDGWEHRVVVEKVLPNAAGTRLPACVDGRRACPPEDCGGPWGFQDLLSILSDPKHPEHDERIEWLGGLFDADAFDPSEFEDNLANARTAIIDDP